MPRLSTAECMAAAVAENKTDVNNVNDSSQGNTKTQVSRFSNTEKLLIGTGLVLAGYGLYRLFSSPEPKAWIPPAPIPGKITAQTMQDEISVQEAEAIRQQLAALEIWEKMRRCR